MKMQEHIPIGIDAIAVHIPYYAMDLTELANNTRNDIKKYQQGLGAYKIAVTHPQEDAVTMGTNAVRNLIRQYQIDPDEIGMIIAGTETNVDASKSLAVYVHGMLNFPANCRTFDIQHACYGATAALKMASAWVNSTGGHKKALVISTDIARYDLFSPGEPTQGAAAVAMVVSQNPGILELLPYPEALYSSNVMDFWRPHYRKTALVDGKYSVECYINGLEKTFAFFSQKTGLSLPDFDHLLFHLPFPKMAQKAYTALYERLFSQDPPLLAKFEESLARQTSHSLWAGQQIGNSYSSSLYINLCALLESQNIPVENSLVGFYSYGSGCCAEFFAGKIQPDSSVWGNKINLGKAIRDRHEIDYETYRQFRLETERLSINNDYCPDVIYGRLWEAIFHGIREDQRIYSPPKSREAKRKPASNDEMPDVIASVG